MGAVGSCNNKAPSAVVPVCNLDPDGRAYIVQPPLPNNKKRKHVLICNEQGVLSSNLSGFKLYHQTTEDGIDVTGPLLCTGRVEHDGMFKTVGASHVDLFHHPNGKEEEAYYFGCVREKGWFTASTFFELPGGNHMGAIRFQYANSSLLQILGRVAKPQHIPELQLIDLLCKVPPTKMIADVAWLIASFVGPALYSPHLDSDLRTEKGDEVSYKHYKNIHPRWSNTLGAYTLDMSGRAQVSSVYNSQVRLQPDPDGPEEPSGSGRNSEVVYQLGKVGMQTSDEGTVQVFHFDYKNMSLAEAMFIMTSTVRRHGIRD